MAQKKAPLTNWRARKQPDSISIKDQVDAYAAWFNERGEKPSAIYKYDPDKLGAGQMFAARFPDVEVRIYKPDA